MSRLTKTDISMAIEILKHPNWGDESDIRKAVANAIEALKELKYYKDLEEQGRLIELPCKVGDTVWCLEEDGYSGYVFIAMSVEYYIVSASYVKCDDIYEQLEEMEDDTENGFEPSVSVFHKDKVFLTKEEAEAKLEELEGSAE